MNALILDEITDKNWVLCKMSLWDYLESINPEMSFDFEIQRGIVKNVYLDTILETIVSGEPFLPLTLLVKTVNQHDNNIVIDDFYILDGLQRTYRLWIYKQIIDIAKTTDLFGGSWKSFADVVKEFKIKFPEASRIIPFPVLMKMFTVDSNIYIDKLEEAFKSFNLYLYIWGNLDEKETVNKMLLLNAGQMRVSLQHQYELMFLRMFTGLNSRITLVRSKEPNYARVKRGNREPGQFLFTTLVIGLRSFIEQKPVRLDRNFNLNDEECISETDASFYFSKEVLEQFLDIVYNFDLRMASHNDAFKKWFVKDTTISSVLGAVGFCIKQKHYSEIDFRNESIHELRSIMMTKLNSVSIFQLDKFEKEYGRLSSVRINIGNVLRKAIFKYCVALINMDPITWEEAFKKSSMLENEEGIYG